jgi:hypothetical protein
MIKRRLLDGMLELVFASWRNNEGPCGLHCVVERIAGGTADWTVLAAKIRDPAMI